MDNDVEMRVCTPFDAIICWILTWESQDEPADMSEEWICIRSGDGFYYLVKGKVASVSGTLKNNLFSTYQVLVVSS